MDISAVAPVISSGELSLAEKGVASAQVILTGFVVVFAVLILLILIIKIYSLAVTKAQNLGKSKSNEAKPQSANQENLPTAVQAATEEAFDGIPEETIAVIAAAVACQYGSSSKTKIKSIKKSNGGRSAWANAGVLDNTRPF